MLTIPAHRCPPGARRLYRRGWAASLASSRASWLAACLAVGVHSAQAADALGGGAAPGIDIGSLVRSAEPVVKGVMLVLLLLSIATWATFFLKQTALRQRKQLLERDLAQLGAATSIHQVVACDSAPLQRMRDVALDELQRARAALVNGMVGSVATRIELKLRAIEDVEQRGLAHGLGLLANVGSNAPFIGLLGTVWGIMHSFMSIAQAKSTSLAVVAPGIAEALFTTALGLAAAIPATVMYNAVGRQIVGYRARMEAALATYLCLVSVEAEAVKLGSSQAKVA